MFKANIKNSSQHELLFCCFCDHVSPNLNKLWLLLFYLRVRFQLASPPEFHFNTSRRGTFYIYIYVEVYMYINVFFHPSAFFSLLTAGLSSCSRHRGTQGGPPGPRTQVWSPAEVRATCSGGSKWHVCSGRHSEGVEPSKPMQTHVHSTLLACKKNA